MIMDDPEAKGEVIIGKTEKQPDGCTCHCA